jgi:hypothetical protein
MLRPRQKRKPNIFVSYRRSDSEAYADRLCGTLMRHFGKQQIFMDVDAIKAGEDFIEVIENAVGACDILLAVIGRQWLTANDGSSRRIDNPNDFVRLEIATALQQNIRVIPVLVQGAAMPQAHELPDDLARLARKQACEISRRNWDEDVGRLINDIKAISKSSSSSSLRSVSLSNPQQPTPGFPANKRLATLIGVALLFLIAISVRWLYVARSGVNKQAQQATTNANSAPETSTPTLPINEGAPTPAQQTEPSPAEKSSEQTAPASVSEAISNTLQPSNTNSAIVNSNQRKKSLSANYTRSTKNDNNVMDKLKSRARKLGAAPKKIFKNPF